MPTTPTYPGVYIEEIPSGVRTITGVATSVAAFVDQFTRGPVNRAVQVLSFADFEREFGGLDPNSEASYAIQQFFLNGGSEAWVIRAARQPDGDPGNPAVGAPSTVGIDAADQDNTTSLRIEAANPGTWGDDLRVGVEPVDGNGTFNLVVSQVASASGGLAPARQTVHRNLTMDPNGSQAIERVVNDETSGSTLVRATRAAGPEGTKPPLANGTLSGAWESETISLAPTVAVNVTVTDAEGQAMPATARLTFPRNNGSETRTLVEVAAALMTGIRAAKPEDARFAGATVRAAGKKKLWVLPGGGDPAARIAFDDVPGNTTASDLRLTVQTSPAQSATTQPAILSGPLPETVSLPANSAMKVKIGSAPEKTLTLTNAFSGKLNALATSLQDLLRTEQENAFKQATVSVAGNRLLILASPGTQSAVEFAKASAQDTTPEKLGLDAGSVMKRLATISRPLTGPLALPKPPRLTVTIGEKQKSLVLGFDNASAGGQVALPDVAASLQAAIARSDVDPAFVNATVAVVDKQLVVLAGEDKEVLFADIPPDTTATSLKLKGAKANVAAYQLGDGRNEQGKLEGPELIGSPAAKTGIYALEDVDLFNILCIPAAANLPTEQRGATISAAISYCERRRAFFLVDTPAEIADPTAIRSWLDAGGIQRSRNAALYYPRVKVPDPLNGFRLRSVGASGSVAGVYARTDAARGVWKAPAGTEATLRNVTALDDLLTDGENGTLNPLAINCLRTFPVFGNVVWGARTLDGADQQASEWKYVPVRRLSLFLEESLYRGTKWVVFEPNGEPLWAQIRLNLGGFMHNLYRQGAFQGTTPRDAYFVKCDKETTTQNDIDLGIVNIVVGFATLKPAEFVIITFQQMAGQLAT